MRAVRIRIDADLLAEVLHLPPNVRLWPGTTEIVIEAAAFADVAPHEGIPIVTPVIHREPERWTWQFGNVRLPE